MAFVMASTPVYYGYTELDPRVYPVTGSMRLGTTSPMARKRRENSTDAARTCSGVS